MDEKRKLVDSQSEVLDTPFSSQLYWLFKNVSVTLGSWAKRNRFKFLVAGLLLLLALFVGRAWIQPVALALRINAFPILLSGLVFFAALYLFKRSRAVLGSVLLLLNLGGILAFVALEGKPREYLGLYWSYKTLQKEEIDELPTTSYERIQPLNSIRALAGEAMTEVEQVSEPSFTRVGDGYSWTMAVEPSFAVRRLTGRVREVIHVSSSAPSPNFSQENRSPVSFLTGEDLLLSRNVKTATIKRFGFWKYFNYQPSDVRYAKDQKGEWVQLVSLTRWKGFFFPRPVFGGVVVIRQHGDGVMDWASNVLFGTGEWIRPSEVGQHEFLKGQNIVPQEVSRFVANSFRFQQGFWAPMPGYHLGDIRIPDLPGDFNDQPFTAYFNFGDKGKLYHYFALEPFQEDKQGLNTSVFAPADGIGAIKVYRHHEKGEALTGVSAIVPKVMESRKNYDWTRNTAAEQRPFIRRINGKTRFFWLTTVVTFKSDDSQEYIAGSAPDVTLTDATYKTVIWVNALKPEGWEAELAEGLSSVWESD